MKNYAFHAGRGIVPTLLIKFGLPLMEHIPFSQRLNGRFDGMVRLTDVDKLHADITANNGWYLVCPDEALPRDSVSGQEASSHLQGLVQEILREERGVWTTMIYVQSAEDPTIIKVFHPRRAGCGCGPSMNVKPWWVLSRVSPEEVPAWSQTACTSPAKSSWWQRGH